MSNLRRPAHAKQDGVALIVGLILLMLMTLLSISAFHIGSIQTVVISNAVHNNQGLAAAQSAIDTVVNSPNFTIDPTAAIVSTSCGSSAAANTLCVSSNNDGQIDYTVTLKPAPFCVTAAPIPANQLDLSAGPTSTDLGCLTGAQQGQWAVSGASTGGSSCASSTWEINAQAVDTITSTSVNVTEGVAKRILTTQMADYCPQ